MTTTGTEVPPFGIATIAGVPYDPSGDGGPANQAAINLSAVAWSAGHLYLTDGARIRRIAPDATITTVVGLLDPVVHQPIPGFSGDGGPALGAQLRGAVSLDFDGAGNLYIGDAGNHCVRKVTARVIGGIAQPIDGTETIATVAGTGTVSGNGGDGDPATSATLNSPRGIAVDPAGGTICIADQNNNNVRQVAAGIMSTLAGAGGPGGFMDGPASAAKFNFPTGVAMDPVKGDVYVADVLNSRIRRISGGLVTTFAGTGKSSAALPRNLNEGGAAIDANVRPVKVKLLAGALYFVDSGVGMIRKIDTATGIVTTVAGSGQTSYTGSLPPLGDGGPALEALLGSGPGGVQDAALDDAGDWFISDSSSQRVRAAANPSVPATVFGQTIAAGNAATVAGPSGAVTFAGDGGPAAAALLFPGGGLAIDGNGDIYCADSGNNRVRKIASGTTDPLRTISTIAGDGVVGFPGAPGPATAAHIQPGSLCLNSDSLYLTNNGNRILEVTAPGTPGSTISIVANASGVTSPPSTDPTPATLAQMAAGSLAFDSAGNLYAADSLNNRIWKVDTNGVASTICGGPMQAPLFGPGSLAFDPGGNLYTVDGSKNRILKIAAHTPHQPLDGTETVTVFAGTGTFGFSGDNGPATAADLNGPGGLVFDTAGTLWFSDGANFRIRKIDSGGIVSTIAGTGAASFSGDGGPAIDAQLRGGPLAFDSFGNLYMTDVVNNVIRVLDNTPPTVTFQTPEPPPNANGWNNTGVTIPFIAADTGAGVASTNPAGPLQLEDEGVAVSGQAIAVDRAGNTATFPSPVVRIDKTAPVISGMPANGHILWPPDGKLVYVATVTATDAIAGVAPGSFSVTGTSNEPHSAPHGQNDISITLNESGGYIVKLRAERLEHGHGRIYTLTAIATDLAGNTSTEQSTCRVPRHHGG